MAYVTTQNLCAGMVVARNLLDRNQRVLLRAGVALSESHIRALRSLGIAGLEIRGLPPGSLPAAPPSPSRNESRPSSAVPAADRESTRSSAKTGTNAAKVESTLQTLRVTRAPSKPLRPKLEPVMAKQSEALVNHMLAGTSIRQDSALAAVIQLCALRLLRSKNVKERTSIR